MSDQYILGISAYHHDSAAALLRNGEIVAAAHEERFTRKKGGPDFPRHGSLFASMRRASRQPSRPTSASTTSRKIVSAY